MSEPAQEQDQYALLGVSRDATTAEIEKAYRKLARKHHPDLGGDKDKFAAIAQAKEILTDPEKRKRYDETGEVGDKVNPNRAAAEMMFMGLVETYILADDIPYQPFDKIRAEVKSAHDKGATSIKLERKRLAKIKRRFEAFKVQQAKNEKAPESVVDMVLAGFVKLIAKLEREMVGRESAQKVAEEIHAMVEHMDFIANTEAEPDETAMSFSVMMRGGYNPSRAAPNGPSLLGTWVDE